MGFDHVVRGPTPAKLRQYVYDFPWMPMRLGTQFKITHLPWPRICCASMKIWSVGVPCCRQSKATLESVYITCPPFRHAWAKAPIVATASARRHCLSPSWIRLYPLLQNRRLQYSCLSYWSVREISSTTRRSNVLLRLYFQTKQSADLFSYWASWPRSQSRIPAMVGCGDGVGGHS